MRTKRLSRTDSAISRTTCSSGSASNGGSLSPHTSCACGKAHHHHHKELESELDHVSPLGMERNADGDSRRCCSPFSSFNQTNLSALPPPRDRATSSETNVASARDCYDRGSYGQGLPVITLRGSRGVQSKTGSTTSGPVSVSGTGSGTGSGSDLGAGFHTTTCSSNDDARTCMRTADHVSAIRVWSCQRGGQSSGGFSGMGLASAVPPADNDNHDINSDTTTRSSSAGVVPWFKRARGTPTPCGGQLLGLTPSSSSLQQKEGSKVNRQDSGLGTLSLTSTPY